MRRNSFHYAILKLFLLFDKWKTFEQIFLFLNDDQIVINPDFKQVIILLCILHYYWSWKWRCYFFILLTFLLVYLMYHSLIYSFLKILGDAFTFNPSLMINWAWSNSCHWLLHHEFVSLNLLWRFLRNQGSWALRWF